MTVNSEGGNVFRRTLCGKYKVFQAKGFTQTPHPGLPRASAGCAKRKQLDYFGPKRVNTGRNVKCGRARIPMLVFLGVLRATLLSAALWGTVHSCPSLESF